MNTRSDNGSAATLVADFADFAGSRTEDAGLHAGRVEAAAQFARLGLPGREREEWKYADLRPFAAAGFRAPLAERSAVDAATVAALALPGLEAHRFVLVDGHYAPALSSPGSLPAGVTITPLAAATSAQLQAASFGQLARTADNAFAALNAAYWQDGLLVTLAPGTALEAPIELLLVSTAAAAGRLVAPRVIVSSGCESSATIVERHVGLPGAAIFCDAITELRVADDARVTHLKLLQEDAAAWHIGGTHVLQSGARSLYRSLEIVLGGASARRELHLDLAGDHARCELEALYLASGDQRRDLRTRVRHSVADCETHELYKGVLDGHARGIFDGLIYVAQDAQRTNARQTNRNLLLSADATAYSMPRLEIYADDVRCTHGSTSGQIADEQLFYLRSRGYDVESARALLTFAFASELLERVEAEPLRKALTGALLERLPRRELVEGSL